MSERAHDRSSRFRLRIAVCALIVTVCAGLLLLRWQFLRPTDSDVYLAALAPQTGSDIILASRPSFCGGGSGDLGIQPPDLPVELFENFIAANSREANPVSLEPLREHFAIADSRELARYAEAGANPSILASGPRTLVYLSRIGYGNERSEALFCAEGAAGVLFHLRLKNGNWHLTRVIGTWDS